MSAVATDEGVLLFSDSVKGMKERTTYLQYLADGFFNFSKKVKTLKLYEIEIPMRQMVELADNCIGMQLHARKDGGKGDADRCRLHRQI